MCLPGKSVLPDRIYTYCTVHPIGHAWPVSGLYNQLKGTACRIYLTRMCTTDLPFSNLKEQFPSSDLISYQGHESL